MLRFRENRAWKFIKYILTWLITCQLLGVSEQLIGGYSTCEKCKMKIFRIKLCFQESIV